MGTSQPNSNLRCVTSQKSEELNLIINKNTSLMQLISIHISLIVSLYMFRAGHCPSSGEYDTVHISDWY